MGEITICFKKSTQGRIRAVLLQIHIVTCSVKGDFFFLLKWQFRDPNKTTLQSSTVEVRKRVGGQIVPTGDTFSFPLLSYIKYKYRNNLEMTMPLSIG